MSDVYNVTVEGIVTVISFLAIVAMVVIIVTVALWIINAMKKLVENE